MNSNDYGQQRLESQDEGLCTFGDPLFAELPRRTEAQGMQRGRDTCS